MAAGGQARRKGGYASLSVGRLSRLHRHLSENDGWVPAPRQRANKKAWLRSNPVSP